MVHILLVVNGYLASGRMLSLQSKNKWAHFLGLISELLAKYTPILKCDFHYTLLTAQAPVRVIIKVKGETKG